MAKLYESLTIYLTKFEEGFGEWEPKVHDGDGSTDKPFQMPFVVYNEAVRNLIKAVYDFDEAHPEFGLHKYGDILEEQGTKWEMRSMELADVSKLDGRTVMALLMGAVRAERFCDGALLSMFKRGTIQKWLTKLDELDSM